MIRPLVIFPLLLGTLLGWSMTAADVQAETSPAASVSRTGGSDSQPASSELELTIDEGRPMVVIPEGRPEWVETRPDRTGPVHRTAVSSGPHVRVRECRRTLEDELKQATREYVNEYLASEKAALLIRYDLDYIQNHLVRPENVYQEVIEVSVGPMHQCHALLEFDERFRQDLDERWNQIVATNRLLQTVLGVAGVLMLLGLMCGCLKLNTVTGGSYAGRLQLLAAAAILAIVLSGMLLTQWIPRI